MEKLATYVAAILKHASQVTISCVTVDRTSWEDQGYEVTKEVSDYRFDNGVVIRHTVERDDFPCEAICAECWITYEVISMGCDAVNVQPQRKVFENACRESFWLAYHSA